MIPLELRYSNAENTSATRLYLREKYTVPVTDPTKQVKKQPRQIPSRVRHIQCYNCGNNNLIHGLTLGKADAIMSAGGPGQYPNLEGTTWAVYLCIDCSGVYPYPKSYPANRSLQQIYQQILNWCDAKAKRKKEEQDSYDQLMSIIKANKELVGLPGLEKDELISKSLAPLLDRIEGLEAELKRRRGGRPRKKI